MLGQAIGTELGVLNKGHKTLEEVLWALVSF